MQDTDKLVAKALMDDLREYSFDFTFLYLGETDSKGHNYGWMSEQQLTAIYNAVDCIQKVYEAYGEEYTIIVTADHGGHGRGHGSDMPEDMTIPLFICGKEKGQLTQDISIMDIAPTIVKLIGLESDSDWNGKSIL